MIIANPIPADMAADGKLIEEAIQQSLKEVEEKHLVGRDITPYILKRVAELTEGKSLAANLALVKNNARVAAEIAVKLAEKKRTAISR